MQSSLVLLVIFPLVCAFIGYLTNVVAVKMIFRPHERVRLPGGLAFQGVLPKHQRHFARELAQVVVRDFIETRDLVLALNRPEVLDDLEARAREMWRAVLDEVNEVLPESKRAMLGPRFVEPLVERLVAEARAHADELIEAGARRAQEVFCLEDFICEEIIAIGPRRLEEIIYEVSARELRFIEYYGGLFGACLGVVQFGVLHLLGDVALPIVGAVVGTVTNWLAIQMLFYPRDKRRYLGIFEYQGLFPKRQTEIAETLGEIAARDFLDPHQTYGSIFHESVPAELDSDHLARAERALRERFPQVGPLLDGLLGPEERGRVEARIAERYPALLERAEAEFVEAAAKLDIGALIGAQVAGLDKSSFEGLLRGLFDREEFYLIVYGGLLGGGIGFLQLLLAQAVGFLQS